MLCLRDAFITIEFESGDTRSMKKYVRPIGMVPKTYQIRKDPNYPFGPTHLISSNL